MPYTLCDLKRDILRTLVYADLFNHAPTVEEIHATLTLRVSKGTLLKVLKDMDVRTDGIRYALREKCLRLSENRSRFARDILRRSRLSLRLLASLPFVRGVFITGSVSTGYAEKSDDLDLLIITENGRLYTARLFVMLLVKVFPYLCPNFFVARGNFKFKPKNYYQAREFLQMLPVYGEDVYHDILEINRWVYEKFPNFKPQIHETNVKPIPIMKKVLEVFARLMPEKLLRNLQIKRFLAKGYRMDEVIVGDGIFKAHVSGHGSRIQKEYERRLKRYGL